MLVPCRRLFRGLLSPLGSYHTCLATTRSKICRTVFTVIHPPPLRNTFTRKHFTTELPRTDSTRFTVQVKGPHETEEDDHRDLLLAQLEKIPRDTQFLEITEDTPSNVEWELLRNHLNQIKDLEMCSGFNEELNDAELPEHWPLERLCVSSACGEVFRSSFVLEGRVKHLALLLTSGLQFEGPTSNELCQANSEAIARGEKEPRYASEKKRLQMISIPELVVENIKERWVGIEPTLPPTTRNDNLPLLPKEVPSKMTKLEIIENDSIDTFNRMTVALPHIVERLSTLNIRSTDGLDFHFTKEGLFTCILPQLSTLKTLVLSVGEVFESETLLSSLYTILPPNLSTLRFRGPTSLVKTSEWDNWMKSFASSDFLPNLKRLSFVLDLHYGDPENNSYRRKKLNTAPEDALRDAQDECEKLYRAVEQRGVVVEPFHDEWATRGSFLKQVDERWMQL
ncbi:uncharacterized protein LDX57_011736 [Aspergillus melleus]|uniref:uncharacterized protein n=1 Tax=Aspergillus melleus TaxID=138277 RepID=UPI001E8DD991|nr:uncharacterized protein LDX57_011736 [Aspergillus melleus]KAH8434098.1 hypothetical protein LDX57_011736 [Aspergillus melleus]